MISFIARRLLWIPITMLFVVIVVFFLSKAVPYDPVDAMITLEFGESMISDQSSQSNEMYIAMAEKLGLDQPYFYFSVLPSHLTSNSKSYLPLHQRHNFENLISKGYTQDEASKHLHLSGSEISKLENKFAFSFPTFIWNGGQNQFHTYVKKAITGDFGVSYLDGRSVGLKIQEALKWTLFMVLIALALSFILGIGLGIFSASSSKHNLIKIVNGFNYFIYAMPLFWLATIALVFLTTNEYGSWTNIFAAPSVIVDDGSGFWNTVQNYGNILILPIILLSLNSLSYISRQMHTSLSKEASKLYATTATMKGLSITQVIKRHTLRNALLPMITLLTSALPSSIAGSVIVETIFNIPGMGRLLYESIGSADWNVVFAIVIITAIISSISFLFSDILYQVFNPKMKLSK